MWEEARVEMGPAGICPITGDLGNVAKRFDLPTKSREREVGGVLRTAKRDTKVQRDDWQLSIFLAYWRKKQMLRMGPCGGCSGE